MKKLLALALLSSSLMFGSVKCFVSFGQAKTCKAARAAKKAKKEAAKPVVAPAVKK